MKGTCWSHFVFWVRAMSLRVVRRSVLYLTLPLLFLAAAPQAQAGQDAAAPADYNGISRSSPKTLAGQSATLLPDGRWLLLGGSGEHGRDAVLQDAKSGQNRASKGKPVHARSYHTATVLPDGRVLILGGYAEDGFVEREAEVFDPSSERFSTVADTGLMPRSRHSATVLTDGRIVITGGVSERGVLLAESELLNTRSLQVESLHASLAVPRSDHHADLLPSAPVLVWGGRDGANQQVKSGELFDPASERFASTQGVGTDVIPIGLLNDREPGVAGSLPAAGTQDVAADAVISVRFTKQLAVASLNRDTVTLLGPTGAVETSVVPAEGGLLLFVTPKASLQPGASYTLFVSGAKDDTDKPLPFTAIGFSAAVISSSPSSNSTGLNAGRDNTTLSGISQTTAQGGNAKSAVASGATSSGDDKEWIPGPEALRGDWRSKRGASPLQQLPALHAAAGVTALAGQVLLLDGSAGVNVTITLAGITTYTDGTGRFLLENVPTGTQTLLIDGRSANRPGQTYGLFEQRVVVPAVGTTNSLGYTAWMPRLDTASSVQLSSPTTNEVVVTTPKIPGLELHIPKGTVIRDRAGNIVTQVSITAIPVDRPPFPLPTGYVPVYFTIQPGSGHLQGIDPASARGAWLVYPNYHGASAGSQLHFWTYDPVSKGWYVYGNGTVSADGRQILPDPGVALYEFTGAMVSSPSNAPPEGPPDGGCRDGDPVDCYTGLFLHERTDLTVKDVVSISVKRTYRPRDSLSRSFGIGTNLGYDLFMIGDVFPYTYQDLILPDGGRVHFARTSAGTSFSDAVYTAASTPTGYFGARLEWASGGPGPWKMTLRDGTVYWFPDSMNSTNPRAAAALRMVDRRGNVLNFTRDASRNLTRITSPNGRFIDLTYDASNRITQARDNIGRTVTYVYDSSGRLAQVTDPEGGFEQYAYDTSNRMTTVTKPNGALMVTNVYDTNGRVSKQTLADGGIYQFAYTLDANGKVTQTDTTDPRGIVRRLQFNSAGYPVSETRALGKPEQQTIVYERQSGTNLLISTTDALGRQTTYTYDALGNTTGITRLAGTAQAASENFTYDSQFSQLLSYTDALSRTTLFHYDGVGNRIDSQDPLGNITRFTYNAAGQTLSITDPLSNAWQFTYDGGDLVSTTDPLGRTATRYTDAIGRLVWSADPLGNRTMYDYDRRNLVTSVTDPGGAKSQYAYDADKNLSSVTDAKGNVTQFAYDVKDRLSSKTDALLNIESYTYDGRDNLTQVTDRSGTIRTYTYDALNRLTKAEYGRTFNGNTIGAPDATVTYTLDAADRMTQIADSQGGTLTRSYDGLDRLVSETTSQGSIAYAYYAAGQRSAQTVAGQPSVAYSYDGAGRLTGLTQASQAVSFTYDAAGRQTGMTLPNGIVASYSYDVAGQLTAITYSKGGTSLGDLSYVYDGAGRRTQVAGSLMHATLPAPVASASYNADNRLTNWAGTALTYDANGRLISEGSRTYGWDSRSRLVTSSGAVSASFAYDGVGRRTSRTVAGTRTDYLYDGLNAVQEQRGAAQANMLVGLGIDQVFARTDTTGARYLLDDALGSTLALIDSSGAIKTTYAYDPFGATTASGEANDNAAQYTGRENDGTGLYYYRARYYDPAKGRFIAEDPIGLSGGLNVYAYVNGDPISNVDPLGLQGAPGFSPITPGPPRLQRCILWLCTVCEPSCVGETCKRFFVGAPPGHPGEGGFFGNGGYAGDASNMKECMCVKSVQYPY